MPSEKSGTSNAARHDGRLSAVSKKRRQGLEGDGEHADTQDSPRKVTMIDVELPTDLQALIEGLSDEEERKGKAIDGEELRSRKELEKGSMTRERHSMTSSKRSMFP